MLIYTLREYYIYRDIVVITVLSNMDLNIVELDANYKNLCFHTNSESLRELSDVAHNKNFIIMFKITPYSYSFRSFI